MRRRTNRLRCPAGERRKLPCRHRHAVIETESFVPIGVEASSTGASRGGLPLVFLFLYLPIAVLVGYSFNTSKLNIVWEGFTLKWFGELLANQPIIDTLKNSLIIAAFTTVASVVIGTGGAWLLHRYQFRFSRAIQTLICVPMIMPEIVMGISLLVFFTVISLGLGYTTVVIAHVTFCFPIRARGGAGAAARARSVARRGGARSRRDALCRHFGW